MIAILAVANLFVGTLIGIAGIAGFLLPIVFTGLLGLPLTDALALSFVSFLTSGLLGAVSYGRAGHLDRVIATPLCFGSVAGALAGVWLNRMIPTPYAKLLLYLVVLASGVSVLLKKDKAGANTTASPLLQNQPALVLTGVLTAAICSLTGAGGPILVVPLLAVLGVNMRTAVGIGLLDSVAIALPACVGYLANSTLPNIGLLCAVSVLTHGVGVLFGTRIAGHVKLKPLRVSVGVLSVGASCYMLAAMLL